MLVSYISSIVHWRKNLNNKQRLIQPLLFGKITEGKIIFIWSIKEGALISVFVLIRLFADICYSTWQRRLPNLCHTDGHRFLLHPFAAILEAGKDNQNLILSILLHNTHCSVFWAEDLSWWGGCQTAHFCMFRINVDPK